MHYDYTTAWGRWRLLQDDLFEVVGGKEAFAKALGMPPWLVNSWNCHLSHLWALVALARQSGAPITIREAREIREAADAEEREQREAGEKARSLQDRQKSERRWIEQNGRDKAWWRLDPANAADTPEQQPQPQEAANG
jgi:hypothetical protein